MNGAAESILAVVARVPRGKVTTYGAVAEQAGWPRRARLVGRVLGALPAGSHVPWHRVVAAGGRIALPEGSRAREKQMSRLRQEGVDVSAGRVDLRRFGWRSPAVDLDAWLWRVGDEN
ncbi:MAG: cysteine methyltransferase [Gammaproteobacteria bacterium]|nr:cysteine methyltransferase [Gammaproteobacteria bacterium]